MGLSRRVQNLIVDGPFAGAKWLRCVNFTRQLFGNEATPPSTIGGGSGSAVVQDSTSQTAAAEAGSQKTQGDELLSKMERIRLSSPVLRVRAPYRLDYSSFFYCFPLSDSDNKVVIAEKTGRSLLCNINTRSVVSMPNLHKPKSDPISIFVTNAADDHHLSSGGSLYIMERTPKCERGGKDQPSDQFEAFVCSKPTETSEGLWHCRLLPPPPFVLGDAYRFTVPHITCYGVAGSHICISTNGIGTYYLDTVRNTWEASYDGTLPFYGNIEYVPELNLWFGFTCDAGHLAAADLSTMDSQPQIVGDWKEFDPPESWVESDESQLVNLGSGRFCIARFFMDGDETIDRIAVFTGVEVMRVVDSTNGKVKLQMKKHKSRYHLSTNGSLIHAVL